MKALLPPPTGGLESYFREARPCGVCRRRERLRIKQILSSTFVSSEYYMVSEVGSCS